MSWGQKAEACHRNCSGRIFANSSVWRDIMSKTSLPLWELTGNYMWRFRMKMKLRLRASHEHANSERGCTSDLKHALLTTPMMLRMRMRMRMLPVLLPMATCRRCRRGDRDWATAKLPVNQPGGEGGGSYRVVNYEVSCDWRFQPPQYLAKARGTSASRS